jgi:hypothetical protein
MRQRYFPGYEWWYFPTVIDGRFAGFVAANDLADRLDRGVVSLFGLIQKQPEDVMINFSELIVRIPSTLSLLPMTQIGIDGLPVIERLELTMKQLAVDWENEDTFSKAVIKLWAKRSQDTSYCSEL